MKKKIILIITVCFVFLIGCSSMHIPYYTVSATLQKPVPSDKLIYSDEFIMVGFTIGMKQINLHILNKTNNAIKINWDNMAYVSPAGKSMRIIHSGVRLIDRNTPQAPTILAPKARVSDTITPSEHIYFISGQYGGWHYYDLFPGKDKNAFKGSTFSIYMPLKIGDKVKEYNFKFQIKDIVETKV